MTVRVLCVGNMYPLHHLGGYELVWQGAVAHLRARGHQVEVLTTDFRRPEVTDPDEPGVHRELRWWWRDHAFPLRAGRARLAPQRRRLPPPPGRAGPEVVCWWSMGGMSLSLLAHAGRAG